MNLKILLQQYLVKFESVKWGKNCNKKDKKMYLYIYYTGQQKTYCIISDTCTYIILIR